MKTIMPQTSKFKRAGYTKGAVVIEFALVIIVLLMIVGAIIEFGRVFWYYDALTKATRDGARLMSMADKATINSVGKLATKNLVVAAANNAQVSPALASGNVQVDCLNASYQVVSCVDGTAPLNVQVSIINSSVDIGGWMPILLPNGGTMTSTSSLAPQTTMRYMQ